MWLLLGLSLYNVTNKPGSTFGNLHIEEIQIEYFMCIWYLTPFLYIGECAIANVYAVIDINCLFFAFNLCSLMKNMNS